MYGSNKPALAWWLAFPIVLQHQSRKENLDKLDGLPNEPLLVQNFLPLKRWHFPGAKCLQIIDGNLVYSQLTRSPSIKHEFPLFSEFWLIPAVSARISSRPSSSIPMVAIALKVSSISVLSFIPSTWKCGLLIFVWHFGGIQKYNNRAL